MANGSRCLPVLALAVSCATFGFPRAHDEGGNPWVRLDSAHCTLFTNLDGGDAEDSVRQLELWWMAMARSLPVGSGGDNPMRVRVVAVRNQWQADEVGGRKILGLQFSHPRLGDNLYIGDPTSLVGRETVRHELGHAFVGAHWSGVPQWLNEGLASYLQTADYDERQRRVTWGGRSVPQTQEAVLDHEVSARDLIASKPWKEDDVARYTFHAGLLVHMLVTEHGRELECYLNALRPRAPAELSAGALDRCFSSTGRWDEELADYGTRPRLGFETKSATFAPPEITVTSAAATDGDVHALLAMLDLHMLEFIDPRFRAARLRRASLNLERALDLQPTNELVPPLASVVAEVDPVLGAKLTLRLTELRPAEWRVWLVRARTPGLAALEARGACDQVERLAPEETDAGELRPCGSAESPPVSVSRPTKR